jgi:hypothetical protein
MGTVIALNDIPLAEEQVEFTGRAVARFELGHLPQTMVRTSMLQQQVLSRGVLAA